MSTSSHKNYFKPADKPQSTSVIKYIGLLLVAFAVLGLVFSSVLGSGGFNHSSRTFGSYGNKDIVYQYDNAFGREVQSTMERYGSSGDDINDFLRRLAWQQAFSRISLQTAIAYHLESSGYQPSQRSVDQRMLELGQFLTDGEFDVEKYQSASASSKASIREILNEQLIIQTWSEDVIDSPRQSTAALNFFADMRSQLNSYNYTMIPFSSYPDEDIIRYGIENYQIFRKMPLSRITVDDEETANEVLTKLNERKQDITVFADLAREYSTDSYKDEGGSMGETQYFQLTELMSKENADAVFALSSGAMTPPFETDYGWMIVRSDGAFKETDVAQEKESVRDYMMSNDLGIIEESILTRAEKIRSRVTSSASFSQIILDEGLEMSSSNAFPLNYGGDSLLGESPQDSEGNSIAGSVSSQEFWDAIAPLKQVGDISRPIVFSDSVGLFVLSSMENQETPENWENTVKYETSRIREQDFESIILSEDSDLYVDNFREAYNNIWRGQG